MAFKRSNEAFWWSLFSAGGVLSALTLPALVVTSGLILPARSIRHGQETYERLLGLVAWWPVRLALAAVVVFSFFHAAHRIRHILIDLGWRHATVLLSLLCYGGAVAGAGMGAYLLIAL